jgi:DNA-binding NarL/FixJ family response regulator
MSVIRIILADDHPLVLRGIRELLAHVTDIDVVAVCTDGAQALHAVRQLKPHVAVLDLSMPGLTGLEVVTAIQAEGLATRALLLAATATSREVMSAMAAGAYGFLLKESQPDDLLKAIRDIAAGHKCLPFELFDQKLAHNGAIAPIPIQDVLTQSEWRVMDLAAKGLSNKEIARQLNISEGTAKVHLHHIFRKVGVDNRTALANIAIQHADRKAKS